MASVAVLIIANPGVGGCVKIAVELCQSDNLIVSRVAKAFLADSRPRPIRCHSPNIGLITGSVKGTLERRQAADPTISPLSKSIDIGLSPVLGAESEFLNAMILTVSHIQSTALIDG
jgi:hypothetical protein